MKIKPGIIISAVTFFMSVFLLTGCSGAASSAGSGTAVQEAESAVSETAIPGLVYESSLPLTYATEFSVDEYRNGYSLIRVEDGAKYLVVPEGMKTPEGLDAAITVLQQPLDHIYLAATSVMSLFDALNSIDSVTFSGTKPEGWYVENAKKAMQEGKIVYAGKYSTPDYELLANSGCDAAIESTMILHTPKVSQMIGQLGIPVVVDRSSYEEEPLGRTEWIKFYGVLLGKEKEAADFFNQQEEKVKNLGSFSNTEKKVVFFYMNTDGTVVVRRPRDYIPKMIELAGGRYVFQNLDSSDDSKSSVMRIAMEKFYQTAKDADYLIYDSTIDPVDSLDRLKEKSTIFSEFKAVAGGNVWTVEQSMYQRTDITADMILDIHEMLTNGDESKMTFLRRMK